MPERILADSAEPTDTAGSRLSAERAADLAGLIRSRFGLDLTQYKPASIQRRLARRMELRQVETVDRYLELLSTDGAELSALHRDLMLTVTAFFRDGAPFDALRTTVIPRLLARHAPTELVKVWVPGCATGQEAYSVAVCLIEAIAEARTGHPFQVFATDAEEGSISVARRGVYRADLEAEVSPERLTRFFSPHPDGGHQVAQAVRDHVVFSRHDLLEDPPFARLDLVTCRNVLIYLRPEAQARVLRRLHFGLLPHGELMLGTSETVGDAESLFTLVDRANKIYAKRPVAASPWALRASASPAPERRAGPDAAALSSITVSLDRVLLEKLAPPAVVIDDRLEVLLFRGKTGPYIEPASGAASFHLLKVTPVELHAELRRITVEALDRRHRATARATMSRSGATLAVQLTAQPLSLPQTAARLVVVTFEAVAADGEEAGPPPDRKAELEQELGNTREYLQDVLEQHQRATEDLRSANEELQASVDELQSTNEELQVSREELQAMNDELAAVNESLRVKLGELSNVNDDLRNVMIGIEHGVLVVGPSHELVRFNDVAALALGLRQADVGRPLERLDAVLGRTLQSVVRDLSPTRPPVDLEAELPNGRWHAVRLRPYVSADGVVLGAVITLQDVDSERRARELGKQVAAHVAGSVGMLREPAALVDGALRVRWANAPWYESFRLTPEEARGAPLVALGSVVWAHPVVLACLAEVARSGVPIEGLDVSIDVDGAGPRRVRLDVSPVSAPPGAVLLLVSTGFVVA